MNAQVNAQCPICRGSYVQFSSLDRGCSSECKAEIRRQKSRKLAAREERKVTRAKLMALRTVSDWTKLAQAEFNRFIRLRDSHLPCISCGRDTGAKRNAGHYLSTGAHPELRFNELNVHGQCEHCNSWKSGNVADYRVALARKIGMDRVEWLESKHEPKRYRVDELIALRNEFRDKWRALKAMRERAA